MDADAKPSPAPPAALVSRAGVVVALVLAVLRAPLLLSRLLVVLDEVAAIESDLGVAGVVAGLVGGSASNVARVARSVAATDAVGSFGVESAEVLGVVVRGAANAAVVARPDVASVAAVSVVCAADAAVEVIVVVLDIMLVVVVKVDVVVVAVLASAVVAAGVVATHASQNTGQMAAVFGMSHCALLIVSVQKGTSSATPLHLPSAIVCRVVVARGAAVSLVVTAAVGLGLDAGGVAGRGVGGGGVCGVVVTHVLGHPFLTKHVSSVFVHPWRYTLPGFPAVVSPTQPVVSSSYR